MSRSAMTIATTPTPSMRRIIRTRDENCIICNSLYTDIAHFVARSKGGLAIEENLILLCRNHHNMYDSGDQDIKHYIIDYLSKHYENWHETNLVYSKWEY